MQKECYDSLDSALRQISIERGRLLYQDFYQAALKLGLWSEWQGRPQPLSVSIRPWLIGPDGASYLHRISWQLRVALSSLGALREQQGEVAELLPLEAPEAECLSRLGSPSGAAERVFCRLDALARLSGPDWSETVKFVETNVVGIGGMTYAPAAGEVLELLLESVLPPPWPFEPLADPRDLLAQELLALATRLGVQSPRVALLDDQRLYKLGGEMGRLASYLAGHGLEARAVDAREVTREPGGAYRCGDFKFDIIYRFLEMRELAEIHAESGGLEAVWQAFREGRVMPTPAGDLDHKSVFEILTSNQFSRHFSASQLKLFSRHVLWTRLLFPRRCETSDGTSVELFEYTERNRERLVIKPNRECGGFQVTLGARVSDSQWREVLDEADRRPKSFVVQEAAETVADELPCLSESGALCWKSRFLSLGLFPGQAGLGALGRFSDGAVVNISQHGGVVPVLVCRS